MVIASLLLLFAMPAKSPTDVVRELVDAFDQRDFVRAATFVAGGRAQNGAQYPLEELPTVQIENLSEHLKGDSAIVNLTAEVVDADGSTTVSRETDHLRRVNGSWVVTPEAHTSLNAPVVESIAMFLQNRPGSGASKGDKLALDCLSNIKMLALCCLLYENDHDVDQVPSAKTWQADIMPYARSKSMFLCPVSHKAAYALNDFIAGKSADRVKHQERVVLVYEGSHHRLAFRHSGRAAVAFMDGHVKLISQRDAKTLRWKP